MKLQLFIFCLLSLMTSIASAQTTITNATVYTGSGEPLESTTVVIGKDGKIQAIGTGTKPVGNVVDGSGKIVTPGFIDAMSYVGLSVIWSVSDASPGNLDRDKDVIQAGFKAADALDPNGDAIPVTRTGGVTDVVVVPTRNLIAGTSAHLELADDRFFANVRSDAVALHIHYGERAARQVGGSRGGAIALIREAFRAAKFLASNRKVSDARQGEKPYLSPVDVAALNRASSGEVPTVFHVNRANDILAVLELSKEFKLRPVIAGGAEAWVVVKELKEASAAVALDSMLNLPYSFDMVGARIDNAAVLAKAGVPIMLTTDDGHNVRNLRFFAGNAVREGLSKSDALTAITKTPANVFGLKNVGELKVGNVGNLVVWSGDPFEPSSHVENLFIGGKPVTLDNRQQQLFEKYRKLQRRAPVAEPASKKEAAETE